MNRQLKQIEKQILSSRNGGASTMLKKEQREKLCANLSSYYGHFLHASRFCLEQALFSRFAWLIAIFELHSKADTDSQALLPLWQPRQVSSFRSQWVWVHLRFHGAIQLIQLGRAFACFAADAEYLPAQVKSLMRPGDPMAVTGAIWTAPLSLLKQVRARLRQCRVRICLWPKRDTSRRHEAAGFTLALAI